MTEESASIPGRDKKLFSSAQCPDRLWGLPSLLCIWYQGFFLREWRGKGVSLTTHLHLVPRLRIVELYLHSPYVFMAWCSIIFRHNFTCHSWYGYRILTEFFSMLLKNTFSWNKSVGPYRAVIIKIRNERRCSWHSKPDIVPYSDE
jgi:hypothetical protein